MIIHQQPETISLAGNPVTLDVSGENMYQQIGSPAILQLIFTYYNTATPTNSITLSWGDKSITIDFVSNNPGVYEYFFSGTINAEWIAGLTEKFNSIYSIQSDFIITHSFMSGSNHQIMFVAKQNGPAFQLTGATTLSTGTLFIPDPAAATDTVIREGYGVIAQLRAGTTVLGTEIQMPDKWNRARFDLSEYLQSAIDNIASGKLPFFQAQIENIGAKKHEAAQSYSMHFGELWNGGESLMDAITGLCAAYGGLSNRKLKEIENDSQTAKSVIDEKGWLTFQPESKKTSTGTPERLYWLRYSSALPESVRLRANIYYSDGSTDENVLLFTTTVNLGEMMEVFLDAERLPYFDVVKYEVWLTNTGGIVITAKQEYTIDKRHYHNSEYFIFRNSLGGYDTVCCTGRIIAQHAISREVFTDQSDIRKSLENVMSFAYKVNTGSIEADYVNWLNDLLLSTEVYWLKMGRLVPVIITSSKKTAFDDMQRRFNIEFSFEISQQETYYSQLTQKSTGGGGAG